MKNQTKNTNIMNNVKICKSILCKSIGLMFSKKIEDKALVFIFDKDTYCGLHMFFVFFPIDVLYLDRDKTVIEMKEKFKPFTFYSPEKKARYVIELPDGKIKESMTEIGDTIKF